MQINNVQTTSTPPNFWENTILSWESTRYEGLFSRILYSSLFHRMNFLAYIVNQFPEHTKIIEIGCGSGRLFSLLDPQKKFQYTGYDISEDAILHARNKFKSFPNSSWHTSELKDIKDSSSDICVSAGLMDWVSVDDFKKFCANNKFDFFIHSFSQNNKSSKAALHLAFSKAITLFKKINYSPHKFTPEDIENYFYSTVRPKIITHKKLSFGALAYNLPLEININFKDYLASSYFKRKQRNAGSIEKFFKLYEKKIILRELKDIKGHVLEIGSGYGFYTAELSHAFESVTCIDPAIYTTDYVSAPNIKFSLISLENSSLPKNKFDYIFILGVLEFSSNQDLFIKKTMTYLKNHRDAKVILMAPKSKNIFYLLYNVFHNLRGHQMTLPNKNLFNNYKFVKKPCGLLNELIILSPYE